MKTAVFETAVLPFMSAAPTAPLLAVTIISAKSQYPVGTAGVSGIVFDLNKIFARVLLDKTL